MASFADIVNGLTGAAAGFNSFQAARNNRQAQQLQARNVQSLINARSANAAIAQNAARQQLSQQRQANLQAQQQLVFEKQKQAQEQMAGASAELSKILKAPRSIRPALIDVLVQEKGIQLPSNLTSMLNRADDETTELFANFFNLAVQDQELQPLLQKVLTRGVAVDQFNQITSAVDSVLKQAEQRNESRFPGTPSLANQILGAVQGTDASGQAQAPAQTQAPAQVTDQNIVRINPHAASVPGLQSAIEQANNQIAPDPVGAITEQLGEVEATRGKKIRIAAEERLANQLRVTSDKEADALILNAAPDILDAARTRVSEVFTEKQLKKMGAKSARKKLASVINTLQQQ